MYFPSRFAAKGDGITGKCACYASMRTHVQIPSISVQKPGVAMGNLEPSKQAEDLWNFLAISLAQ